MRLEFVSAEDILIDFDKELERSQSLQETIKSVINELVPFAGSIQLDVLLNTAFEQLRGPGDFDTVPLDDILDVIYKMTWQDGLKLSPENEVYRMLDAS